MQHEEEGGAVVVLMVVVAKAGSRRKGRVLMAVCRAAFSCRSTGDMTCVTIQHEAGLRRYAQNMLTAI